MRVDSCSRVVCSRWHELCFHGGERAGVHGSRRDLCTRLYENCVLTLVIRESLVYGGKKVVCRLWRIKVCVLDGTRALCSLWIQRNVFTVVQG